MLGPLRQGALGPVWKAKDLVQNRVVELQTLPLDSIQAPERREAFRKRITTLAALSHPHLAKVYDGNAYGNVFYLVGEFVSDTSVSAWFSKDTPLENVLAIAETVASALDYAWNTANVVHGTLTLERIRVTDDGVLKLADLGLSEYAEVTKQPDIRGDVYSLGMILREAMSVLPADAPATSQIRVLTEKMTAESLDRRYSDWGAVLRDIQRSHLPLVPLKAPTSSRAWKMEEDPARKTIYLTKPARSRSAPAHRQESRSIVPLVIGITGVVACLFAVWMHQAKRPAQDVVPDPWQTSQPAEAREPNVEESASPSGSVVQAETTIIAPAPAAPMFDALTNRAEGAGEILWQAGKLNGLPRDGFEKLVAGEYSVLSVEDKVVQIRKPEDFVQVLAPGQAFVIHVGALKYGDAVLKLAVNSAKPFSGEARPCDYADRRVQVLWNGTCVWRRWIPSGHTIMEAFVSGEWMEPGDNLLTLQNEGQECLCIDAVWIEALQPGPRMFAALESGNTIGADAAAYAPICVIKLPAPVSGTGTFDRVLLDGLPKRRSPSSVTGAVGGWKALRENVAAGPLLEDQQKKEDGVWQAEIAKALQRGMLPVIEIPAQGPDDAWLLWAQRYGAVVGHWILNGSAADVGRITALLKQRVPDVTVTRSGSPVREESNDGTDGMLLNRNCGYWGARQDAVQAQLRLAAWSGNPGRRGVPDDWLRLSPAYQSWADVQCQRKHASMLAEGMLQWWMAGGNKIVVAGGEPGEVLFPDGSGVPGVSWNAARLLLNFGNGSAQRSICNVVGDDKSGALGDTYWAAACDSTQSVSVALFAGERDSDREAKIVAPVPWTGKTQCVVDSVRLRGWRKTDPEVLVQKRLDIDVAPTLLGERRFAQKSATGYARFPVKLASVHLVRLTPVWNRDVQRQINKEAAKEAPRPPIVRGLFRPTDKPQPSDKRIVPLRTTDGLVESLSARDGAKAAAATTGSFAAWDLRSPYLAQTVEAPNLVPWETRSIRVTPGRRSGSNDVPAAVRLYWDSGNVEAARISAFWVRANPSSGTRQAGGGRSAVSFLLGTCEKRERLAVKPGQWQQCTFQADPLRDRNGRVPSYLTLWGDPETTGSVELEFNGFVGFNDRDENGKELSPVKARMRFDEKQSELVIGLQGRAGMPAWWNVRLPYPVEIEKATLVDGDIGCSCSYSKDSQVLQVKLASFPAPTSPAALSAQKLFPDLAAASGSADGTNSLVVLRCRVRR